MLEKLRLQLSRVDAVPQLALLGILCGLIVAIVIAVFRLTIESVQAGMLIGGDPENYESLSIAARFFLPVLGAVLVGLLFYFSKTETRQIGVVHVLERLGYFQGRMHFKNMMMQFIGAAISIISGHSVGREGPGIHLGAASSSLLGKLLDLPNNCIRILVACGVAASIAASFNTPIAGVIFAMEVIVMEYTTAGFTPIILAAVSATALTQYIYGNETVFTVPALKLASFAELPILLFMGLLIGTLAAIFIKVMEKVTTLTLDVPLLIKFGLAGITTGICAVFVPQIMGIGYDTVNAAMLGQLSIGILLLILVFKLLATTIGLGLGLPGGLIGPTLVVGATAGGLVGVVAEGLFPGSTASPGFYAMIGMGAMMGATLQAPLAALMALLEMTVNTHIILPAMFVIIVAGMTSRHVFACPSIFVSLIKLRGLDYKHDPIAQSLRSVGVAGVMDSSFVQMDKMISRSTAESVLNNQPQWIIIEEKNTPIALMLSADLALFISSNTQDSINLLDIPAQREDAEGISIRSTLQQALDTMNDKKLDTLYVWHSRRAKTGVQIKGIITRQTVESHYRYR